MAGGRCWLVARVLRAFRCSFRVADDDVRNLRRRFPRVRGGHVRRQLVALDRAIALLPFLGDALLRAVSLDVTDTVGDYRRAQVEDAVGLQMRLCRNRECLRRLDWACGFSNGDEEAFTQCFDDVIARANQAIRLEDVRKYYGNVTMKFAGTVYSTPEKCHSAGGE